MDQVLTVEQVKKRFDSEWILLADPKVDASGRVLSGRVAAHSRDRDEVYRRAVELKLNSSATLYTGKIPHGTAIVL